MVKFAVAYAFVQMVLVFAWVFTDNATLLDAAGYMLIGEVVIGLTAALRAA
jgi:hypothetical protein